MIAQTRPDIANVTEQTVLALKDLESRIGVLKGDLAVLCQNLGHPEAARIAASPSGAYGAPGFSGVPGFPTGQFANPWGVTTAPSPFGPGFAPFGTAPATPFSNVGYAAPWATANPYFGAHAGPYPSVPFVGPAFPYGTTAWPQQVSPHAGGWVPAHSFSPFAAAGIPTAPPSPFAAIPAGYR